MCVSSVGFAWGVLRGVLGEIEQTDALTTYNVFYLRRLGMRDTLNGLRIWVFSQKLSFSVGKKMFQRQI